MFKKHWFLIINIISFFIAIMDEFVSRNSSINFPVFAILGVIVASAIGGVCLLIRIIKKYKKVGLGQTIIELIVLYFTLPFLGIIGAAAGMLLCLII